MSSILVSPLVGKALLDFYGFRVEGGKPPVRKAVVVAAPHTSNWDMPLTLACAGVLGVELRFVAKHTLFRPPFGGFMRSLGGIAVDRRKAANQVDAIASVFEGKDDLYLVIPPEGTRSHASRWKSGFYWIAVAAKVPIILGFLDYEKKVGGLGTVFEPTGDIKADFPKIRAFYANVKGLYPEKQSEITLKEESEG